MKYHNYFKVHCHKKEYIRQDDNELSGILMEEFYLLSDSELTKNYSSHNPKEDNF